MRIHPRNKFPWLTAVRSITCFEPKIKQVQGIVCMNDCRKMQ